MRKINDTIKGTNMRFHSIPATLAKKLLKYALDATRGDVITINGVEYTFDSISINMRFYCISVYFVARGRFYRISDHWSFVRGRFVKSVGRLGQTRNAWTLDGQDNSFKFKGEADNNARKAVYRRTFEFEGTFEGGYCPRRERKFHG